MHMRLDEWLIECAWGGGVGGVGGTVILWGVYGGG